MAEVIGGSRTRTGPVRDDDNHRTYRISHLVKVDPETEGGYAALSAPGIPLPGDEWNFDGDSDPFAYCTPQATVSPHEEKEGELPTFYKVEQVFTTKPRSKCSDAPREDPLTEPMNVSGDFRLNREESSFDRFGRPIVTSSWELIRGKDNEWDVATATVEVEQNVADLELPLCTFMKNRVNMFPLWGMPVRCIRLTGFNWSRKYYGQCYVYYTRKFTFEINWNTHDRNVLDEGTKCLRGKWLRAGSASTPPVYQLLNNPNRFKPGDFIRYTDPNGNPNRVILNGFGLPSGVCVDYNNATERGEADADAKVYIATPYTSESNRGVDLQSWDDWVQVAAGETQAMLDAEPYRDDLHYIRGNLVTFSNQIYICISDTTADIPSQSFNWRLLILGINNRGTYDNTATYVLGDAVSEPVGGAPSQTGTAAYAGCRETSIGYKHVEKYHEANFLLLGIPVIL